MRTTQGWVSIQSVQRQDMRLPEKQLLGLPVTFDLPEANHYNAYIYMYVYIYIKVCYNHVEYHAVDYTYIYTYVIYIYPSPIVLKQAARKAATRLAPFCAHHVPSFAQNEYNKVPY